MSATRPSHCLIALATLLSALPACRGATPTLDQSLIFADHSYHVISPEYSDAQSFTVGFSGLLSRMDLAIHRAVAGSHPLTLQVRPVNPDNSLPNTVLASLTLSPTDLPYDPTFNDAPPVTVDWSTANLWVSPGQQLALVAFSDEPYNGFEGYWWRQSSQGNNPYAAGVSYLSSSGPAGPWHPVVAPGIVQDHWMQTYVTIPEPASIASTLLAITVTTRHARRTRRRLA